MQKLTQTHMYITQEDVQDNLRCKTVSEYVDYVDKLYSEDKLIMNTLPLSFPVDMEESIKFSGYVESIQKSVEHELGVGDIEFYQPENITQVLKNLGYHLDCLKN